MRISQVAELTGLNVSSIRFYERKGLLLPVREEESKYRNYTEEDVQRIKQILLYRKMGIPIETIYLLFCGQADVTTVLLRQKSELKSQIENLQGAIDLCDLVLKDKALDSEKLDEYLNYVHEEEKKGKKFAQVEELLEDIAKYTQMSLFRYEPWMVWLLRKPWLARIFSVVLWISVFLVPFVWLYPYFSGGKEVKVMVLVAYGLILGVYVAGFSAFRRAKKDYQEGDMEE